MPLDSQTFPAVTLHMWLALAGSVMAFLPTQIYFCALQHAISELNNYVLIHMDAVSVIALQTIKC